MLRTTAAAGLATLFVLVSAVVACTSSDGDAATTPSPVADAATSEARDAGPSKNDPNDAASAADAADGSPPKGPPPSTLPVSFTRPDVGTPVTQTELEAATDKLIAILKDTRYFDVVDERIHGWPENAPGYFYGTWWSGVEVKKQAGKVTYLHLAGGADNNGLRTAPYLEGACYAHLMWGAPLTAKLVRRMARGYSSWALAMKRYPGDSAPTMLTRASYPSSVTSTEGGRDLYIDYSLNRPGEDNSATDYVHVPTNPTFGDIYIKNKRSKDDMGHILRSVAQVQVCGPRLDAAGAADIAEMKAHYAAWSSAIEAQNWSIPTFDKNTNIFTPPPTETLAHYLLAGDIECPGPLAMSLLAHGTPGSLSCGSGLSNAEKLAVATKKMRNNVLQILRSHHEAAVSMALLTGQKTIALELLAGLTERLDMDVPVAMASGPQQNFEDLDPTDIVSLVLHAANTGVPLTSREVRWIHSRIDTAHVSFRSPAAASTFRVFDPATPDGNYLYEPSSEGIWFSDLGVLLGTCASPLRNPTSKPLLDCTRLLAAFPQ